MAEYIDKQELLSLLEKKIKNDFKKGVNKYAQRLVWKTVL